MRFARPRSSRPFVRPLALTIALVLVACGVSEPDGDDPSKPPIPADGGTTPPTDGARPPSDGGPGIDSGRVDGSPVDGGPGIDASRIDGGPGDAALDAPVDAALDARPVDGGPRCTTDDDCEGLCVGGVCAAPTHTDGKRSPSLGETDIDCGGPTARGCDEGRTCVGDADCASAVCSNAKVCVAGASCRGSVNGPSGIDTCGTGEPGAPGAVVESCCRSLPLPTTTTRRLDRYEITAGRMRAFITDLADKNAGVPNVRAFATAYAAANPTSQLADVVNNYPGLIDVLPDRAGPTARLPLPVHLGAFPLDPINALDGCYVGDGAYGHATYWQPTSDLAPLGVATRRISREELDKKPMNCVMALMLSAFCAWDGGELARTADFREVWGRSLVRVGTVNVYIPWATLLDVGQFNWRNGHGTTCNPAAWPGCVNPQNYFYRYPLPHNPANDDSNAIAAPGRFPLDVTRIVSASGEGWYDIGGNMMDMAWPVGTVNPGAGQVRDVCDVSRGPAAGETPCARRGTNGVFRYQGNLPHIALVGYSYEGHARRSENYLSAVATNEGLIVAGDLKPVTFQYGKVGGRCAR